MPVRYPVLLGAARSWDQITEKGKQIMQNRPTAVNPTVANNEDHGKGA